MNITTISNSDYELLRFALIKAVEGTNKAPHIDDPTGVNLVTIGTGFNIEEEGILRSVLENGFNVDLSLPSSSLLVTAMLTETRSSKTIDQIRVSLDNIWSNHIGIPNSTFEFTTDSQMLSVFSALAPIFESKIDAFVTNQIDFSTERAALFSLAYNQNDNNPLLGIGLGGALDSSNRVQAWFEILYESNLTDIPGIAKRRYLEAAVFGLYDDSSNPTPQEANDIIDFYIANIDKIRASESDFHNVSQQALLDPEYSNVLGLLGFANPEDALVTAVNYLEPISDTILEKYISDPDILTSIAGTKFENVVMGLVGLDSMRATRIATHNHRSVTENDLVVNIDNVSSELGGGKGDDVVIGNASADSMFGQEGNDTLIGQAGEDILEGFSGEDKLYGGADNDKLYADTATSSTATDKDELYGGDGEDELFGDSGDDILDGGTGADVMVGKNGDDTYYIDNLGDSIVETTGQGDNDTVVAQINYTLSDDLEIETIELDNSSNVFQVTGNNLDNLIVGNSAGNVLNGVDGDDTLFGGQGDDILSGGDGNDTIDGGSNDDTLIGGIDNDILRGGSGFDTYVYDDGDGQDTIEDTGGRIIYNGDILNGGLYDASNDQYVSRNGLFTYKFDNNDLVINQNITLKNYQTDTFGLDLIQQPNGYFADYSSIKSSILAALVERSWIKTYGNSENNNYLKLDEITIDEVTYEGFDIRADYANYNVRTNSYTEVTTFILGNPLLFNDYTFSIASGQQTYDYFDDDAQKNYILGTKNLNTSYTYKAWDYYGEYNVLVPVFEASFDYESADILHGTANADIIKGFTGDDEIYGLDGNDSISASNGASLIYGGEGNDLISVSGYLNLPVEVSSNIDGGNGNDLIQFYGHTAIVDGGDGNDIINIESINGGVFNESMGVDILSMDSNLGTEIEAHSTGYFTDRVEFETLRAGEIDEILTFSELQNLSVLNEEYSFTVNFSNDIQNYSFYTSTINVSASDAQDVSLDDHRLDELDLNGSIFIKNNIDGNAVHLDLRGSSVDQLISSKNIESRTMFNFNGVMYSLEDIREIIYLDSKHGTMGNDIKLGTSENDRFIGYEGDDTLSGVDGDDSLFGGEGSDTLYGGSGDDLILGESGNDFLFGGEGSDRLSGDSGNDVMSGGSGNDRYFFGLGDDTDTIIDGIGNNLLLSALSVEDVKFTKDDMNLTISVLGSDDKLMINDWFTSSEYRMNSQFGNTIIDSDGIELLMSDGTSDTVNFKSSKFSSFGGQDGNGVLSVLDDGNGISLAGNTWKKMDFPYAITQDTVLTFEYRSTIPGEIQGIGIDTDNSYKNEGTTIFVLNNTQSNIPNNFLRDQNYSGNGDWQKFSISLDDYYSGNIQHLTFLNDDDPEIGATSEYRNVAIAESPLTSSKIFGNYSNESLDGSEFSDYIFGNEGVDNLNGNAGNDVLFGGTGNDVLNGGYGFDTYIYRAGDGNDTIEDSDGVNTLRLLQLRDSDVEIFRQEQDLAIRINDTQEIISISKWFSSTDYRMRIKFSDATFSPTEVESLIMPEEGSDFHFHLNEIVSYTTNQDLSGLVSVIEDGKGIKLFGNTWKKVPLTYDVTQDSVLTFEYKSNVNGEIKGIGIDTDNSYKNGDGTSVFVLAGTQSVSYSHFINDYTYETNFEWQTFSINIGNYQTGEIKFLTFLNDDDADSGATSSYRNISISEPDNISQNDASDLIDDIDEIYSTLHVSLDEFFEPTKVVQISKESEVQFEVEKHYLLATQSLVDFNLNDDEAGTYSEPVFHPRGSNELMQIPV